MTYDHHRILGRESEESNPFTTRFGVWPWNHHRFAKVTLPKVEMQGIEP